MIKHNRDEDTVCAVSTPPGVGGISVIRVSGEKAFEITQKICPFLPRQTESHKVYYGILIDPFSQDKKLNPLAASSTEVVSQQVDEVLVTVFHKGRSFTGENTTEISLHGNPLLVSRALKLLVVAGARIADRGEFTYRAFMNGRLDLVQAESVLSLIESKSQQAAKFSLRQLQGTLSNNLNLIEEELIYLLAHIEADIDFSTEGLDTIDFNEISNKILNILNKTKRLVDSYQSGKKIKNGYLVSLLGKPNVGKSSLYNLLIEEDKAIVTDEAGTTRDVLEWSINLSGFNVTITDTAGIRESNNVVERIGIKKSLDLKEESDLVVLVLDPTSDLNEEENNLIIEVKNKNHLIILNKSDIASQEQGINLLNSLKKQNINPENILQVSAKNEECGHIIRERLGQMLKPLENLDSEIIVQSRHFYCLEKMLHSLVRALNVAKTQKGHEFISLELREALLNIQEVLGKYYDDQILDKVFKEFCIGK